MDKIKLFGELKTFYKDKKVFLTGHTGFKGTWLVKILNLFGAKVYGFSLPKSDKNIFYNSSNLVLDFDFEGDISNINSLNNLSSKINPEIIINMAAQALVFDSYKNPIYTYETNVMGTLNLLNTLNSFSNLKVALFVTTDKVYRNDNLGRDFIESDPLGGYDPYSASKAASEIIIESWRKTMNPKDIQILSARSGNVIGGGDWSENRLIPDIFKALKSEISIVDIRNPYSTRPWQHVIEPLIGYLMYIMYAYKTPNNKVFSLNFGPNSVDIKSVNDVILEIANIIKINPNKFVQIKKSNFYESKFLSLNNNLAKKILGWTPRFSFPETIKLTVNWYLNNDSSENPSILLNQINSYFE